MGQQMTAEVLPFTGITTLDLDPIRVLEEAKGADLAEVVICGVDVDGNEFFSSSVADGSSCGWHLDRAKWNLMRQLDRMIEGEE
jgi:hypothetical protein